LDKSRWTKMVQTLIGLLPGKQEELAARLEVSQQAVSRWARGEREPDSAYFLKMARIVPSGHEELERYFYSRAGLDLEELGAVLSSRRHSKKPIVGRTAAAQNGSHSSSTPVVTIPVLAASDDPRFPANAEIEEEVTVPLSMVPRPDVTVCIRARGDAMSPLIKDGFIVAIDTSKHIRSELEGHIIAVRDPKGGMRLKYLRGAMLVPHNSASPQIPFDRAWRLVGEVIWWIGKPEHN
jgi:SOS-response transcriptional repressor LexA